MKMNVYIADELAERVVYLSKALNEANKVIDKLQKENMDLKLTILVNEEKILVKETGFVAD